MISGILMEILKRIRLSFSLRELLQSLLPCWSESRVKRLKHRYRSIYLLRKGIKKIDYEFDAINMIKLMKQMKLLVQVLLNPTQKMLLGFQKKNVLDSDSDEFNNSDDGDDLKFIQKMKSDNSFIRLMN
jgi:hypothetical protein